MIKTQIQIENWQYEAIKRETTAASRSMSDFIREAVIWVDEALYRVAAARARQAREGRLSLTDYLTISSTETSCSVSGP